SVRTNGAYYLVFQADTDNYLVESNFDNNVVSVPVTFHIHLPDLGPVAFQAPRFVAGPPNSTFTVTWGVTNRGLAPVVSDFERYDYVYLSTNAALDDSAQLIWTGVETNV